MELSQEHLRGQLFWGLFSVSGVVFVAVSVVLLIGDCRHEKWNLQYVSTQLAACLDTLPEVSWIFVLALEVQAFLLLFAWERLFRSTNLLSYFECLITATVSGFVISMASVVEFRADRNTRSAYDERVSENILHTYAAVLGILAFGVLHGLMAYCLRCLCTCKLRACDTRKENEALCAAQQTEENSVMEYKLALYVQLDEAYSFCVVTFFILWWLSASLNARAFFPAAVAEWLIVIIGACMHVYGIFQITRPMLKNSACESLPKLSVYVVICCLLGWTFSVACTSLIFVLAPVSTGTDTESLHTSGMFLFVVISTYAGTAWFMSQNTS
jgi:hypothetical protein